MSKPLSFVNAVREKRSKPSTSNADRAIIIPGTRETLGDGGTVDNAEVRYDGRIIGTIQTRRDRFGREVGVLTITPDRTKAGRQIEWLIIEDARRQDGDSWIGKTFRRPEVRTRLAA